MTAPAYQIVSDPQTMTIRVGSVVFDRPYLARRAEVDFSVKEAVCNDDTPADGSVKALHKFYSERLGPRFNRRFQAANYWLWLGNCMLPTTADMLRYGRKRWFVYNDDLVERAHQCLPYVSEAEADELHHLIPAIVVFKAPPAAIKRQIGGAAWKRVAHNSRTRNRRLMQTAWRSPSDENFAARFVRLLDYPSGVLNGVHGIDEAAEDVAARVTPRKTSLVFQQTMHTVRDTQMMLGDDFNPHWSFARIQREHELAVRERRGRKFSSKPFAEPWSFEKDGFIATLLTSQLDIAVEGDTQHHCVASYAGQAARHDYLVVRIEGRERATAGYRPVGRFWRLDQVYGACNGQVTDACHKFAAEALTIEASADLTAPDARAA